MLPTTLGIRKLLLTYWRCLNWACLALLHLSNIHKYICMCDKHVCFFADINMFLYILTYLYVYVTYIRTYLHTFLHTCRKESTSKLFLPRLHATRALHLSHLHWQDFWGSGNWNAEMESHWKLKIAHSTIKKLSFYL